ncbi:HK97 family phage prohead protease [Shimwellia blattae]|uniref:Phage prohead protease n=1 Tax=Shimwellia blattae (strain ATCC 29907 / DSM 4481 / JCM 1650 / NBRC 105725 / CDC 9005-74) TaxID=630626 RepID=I2B9E6_SHIBC|nr:HK97 family phage prohead protease [Shimwellia blattae]AFJ47150.1 phage prohead protease [Shimwellia blattae DSM 4481 = NBRC 105725]GAB80730.1 putative phage prohead protease [Shimwellia blattae DSM 4481 = NBRC 105725]VDY64642.1 phage prohead protease, HK97 family [Shimwellia blattae]VEC22749.1 phage prohead protease, HK97 family [Shimwellia blattae]
MQRKNTAMKIKAFDFDIKAVSDDGLFSGYGSVFNVVDSYNEVVAPGAFLESIEETRAKERTFPVLWQHRSGEPIGNWDISSLKEDSHGLFGEGVLWLEDAHQAKTAWRGMKTRAITGLSIGYYVRESNYDEKTRIRTLTKLDLVEISIVTLPANDEARIDVIKSVLAHGNLPSLPEFEKFLREAGFSKTQSVAIASGGLSNLLYRSESGGDDGETKTAIADMVRQLSQFTLPTIR